MGDGIMALFGAPLAHEDHAVRACYAALRMQEVVRRYSEELRRAQGVEVQIRVGLNSGEVVVRSIGSDLRMDYTAVGQTTHLAARMEQLAAPGSIRLTAETLYLAEGFVQVTPLGPVPIKGLAEPVGVFELAGAGAARTRLEAAARRGLTRFVGRTAELEQLRDALTGPAWATARWSPWSGSRAWASRVSSGSSPTPTACTAGSSCTPPRSPTARPRPTCP
jgi:class 3 adenylate cyclase